MMGTSPSTIENSIGDRETFVQKKALIMTLGNTKDVNGLLKLLETEENDQLRCDIVTVIGAMGNSEILDILHNLLNNERSERVKNRIENAIDVLNQFSHY